MKKNIFWLVLFAVSAVSIGWLSDILIKSKQEYDRFRGAAKFRQAYARSGAGVGLAAAGDWGRHPELLKGIRMAVEEINTHGGLLGRQVLLQIEDDRGTLKGAFEATQRICDRTQTLFVIGHANARLSQAVVQNYEFYGVLMLSPLSANLTRSQKNFKYIFSNSIGVDTVAETLLALARKKQWSKIGLVYDESDYNREMAQHFESILVAGGIKLPLLLGILPDQLSHGLNEMVLHRPRELQFDALVVAAGVSTSLTLIDRYREAGLRLPIVMGQAPQSSQMGDVPHPSLYWPVQTGISPEKFKQFSIAYQNRFKTLPNMAAASGYDTLKVLAQAVQESQSLEAETLAKTLKQFRPATSLTGTIGFDDSGNAVKTPLTFDHIQ